MKHLKLSMSLIEPAPFDPTSKLTRSIQKDKVDGLAESMKKIGLLTPLAVKAAKVIRSGTRVDGWQIIYGHHRMKAAESLWWKEIDCFVYEDGEIDSKAAIISENLHRAELTTEELKRYRTEWAKSIMGKKRELQVSRGARAKPRNKGAGQGVGGGRPKGGVRAAAREMGMPETTVRDSIKASDTDDTKRQTDLERRRRNSREWRARNKASKNVVQFVPKAYTEVQWNLDVDSKELELEALMHKASIDWVTRREENKRRTGT